VLAQNEKLDKDRLDKSSLCEVVTSIFIASTQRGDYKVMLEQNQLTLETINTIFRLDENVIVTMSRLALNETLILVKKAYAQVEHLLGVPVEVNV
jgi:hypothetical protein